MSNEYKTIDLCGRLPYGVLISIRVYPSSGIEYVTEQLRSINLEGSINGWYDPEYVMAYLRPMDSMTKEEREELDNTANNSPVSDGFVRVNIPSDIMPCVIAVDYTMCDAIITWLNAHHFDYRGLIEQGLALTAPEDMYKPKNQ